jgi:four helix bundle protein
MPAMEKSRDLKVRSFEFAVQVVSFSRAVRARDLALRGIADQLVAAAGSVGANLEEAAAGQSRADFIAKTCIALKEARESRYWLRVIAASCPSLGAEAELLTGESCELVAMLTAAINTARRNARVAAGAKGRDGS